MVDVASKAMTWSGRMAVLSSLYARGKHLLQHAHQSTVFQGRSDALLIAELLVDLLIGAMGALFDAHVDAEARGEGLLKADTHAEADDGGQRTVGNGGRDVDADGADGRLRRSGR